MKQFKKYIYLISLILFTYSKTYAVNQNNADSSAVFTGQYKGSADIGTFTIKASDNALNFTDFFARAELYETPIKGNKFSVSIPTKNRGVYVQFRYGDSKLSLNGHNWILLNVYQYLIEPGSRVNMIFSDDTCFFQGKGAELLTCQYKIHQVRLESSNIRIALGNSLGDQLKAIPSKGDSLLYGSFTQRKILENTIVEKQMNILNSYKSEISESNYSILQYDIIGDSRGSMITSINFDISAGLGSNILLGKKGILKFYADNYWFAEEEYKDIAAKMTSRSYVYSLYSKTLSDFTIPMNANNALTHVTFGQVYGKIKSDFKNPLLDKLIANLFQRFGATKEIPDSYFKEALELMEDRKYMERVEEMAAYRKIGSEGYDFKFEDENGKLVQFKDLKSKIVILDFWFTGCHGCATLTKAMNPIIEHFKNREDIQFVGISVDKDPKMWKKSIKKGIYTHPESMNLYTNGEGEEAAIIKHYNISAYPTLLIFDKEGKLAAFNPKSPYTESSKREFIALINELTLKE